MENLEKDLTKYQEWIIELMTVDSTDKSRRCFATLGKIFVPQTLQLNNQQLEAVYDLCNYGPANYEPYRVTNGIYANMDSYVSGQSDMIYIPMNKGLERSAVNDDIFIREHHNINYGYYIFNDYRTTKDEWRYSDRKTAFEYLSKSMFVW